MFQSMCGLERFRIASLRWLTLAGVMVTPGATCLALAVSGTNVLGASIYLADNLAASSASSVGVTGTNWIAQGFTTTPDAYVITSITVPLAQSNVTSGALGLYIYDATGENGRPGSQIGSEVGTIEYSMLPTAPTFNEISFGSSVSLDKTLAPSTSYFLVMKGLGVVGDTFRWSYTASVSEIGFPSAYTYSDDGGVNWALPDNTQPQQMRIEASVVVPEPGTCALTLAGLAYCGWQLGRRRRLRVTRSWGRFSAVIRIQC